MSEITDKSIASLSSEEALAICRELGQEAIKNNNLGLIFGSNGHTGARARGVYSLLSKGTGLTRSFIGRMLKGQVSPSEQTLIKLEEVTGIERGQISRYMQSKRKLREERDKEERLVAA